MNISELDLLLVNLGVVASFKNLNSKTELSGEKCKIITDYVKKLETMIKKLNNNISLNNEEKSILENIILNK